MHSFWRQQHRLAISLANPVLSDVPTALEDTVSNIDEERVLKEAKVQAERIESATVP